MKRALALRWTLLSTALVAAPVFTIARQGQWEETRPHLFYLTGWVLFGLILCLTAYNVRKKLASWSRVSSRRWFQAHVYLGLFTVVVFLLHIQWRWPTGRFEILLALLFGIVAVSGVAGWWLSRALPQRLTTLGGEVPYERIPVIRRALREEAERLVLGAVPTAKATTLADFYSARLAGFFAGPGNFTRHLVNSRHPLNTLLRKISEVKRFANEEEQKSADALARLVQQKDALDFHHAIQLTLKGWLFVHIPLTYALLVMISAHLLLVYGFSGGAR
jgi:hypothetical protein